MRILLRKRLFHVFALGHDEPGPAKNPVLPPAQKPLVPGRRASERRKNLEEQPLRRDAERKAGPKRRMPVGRLGSVGVDDIRGEAPDQPGHAPGVESIEREVAVGMVGPEKMDRHALDLAVEVAGRPVSLRNDLHVESGSLLGKRVVQHPSAGMLFHPAPLGMAGRNGNIAKMENPHRIAAG